ncbi:MAG TPA: YraN family protein [Mycobacteriales bacterium]|jgi:putative endonuclease|nr:YraN family protein [Mycobacteriales bacterium]
MDRTTNQVVGDAGELAAAHYLERTGYVLLDRNWRCHEVELRGELDIVARERNTIVFCEVKTRQTLEYGTPAEAVIGTKARRIRRLALAWLRRSELRPQELRFDVIGVWLHPSGSAHLDHIRAAF